MPARCSSDKIKRLTVWLRKPRTLRLLDPTALLLQSIWRIKKKKRKKETVARMSEVSYEDLVIHCQVDKYSWSPSGYAAVNTEIKEGYRRDTLCYVCICIDPYMKFYMIVSSTKTRQIFLVWGIKRNPYPVNVITIHQTLHLKTWRRNMHLPRNDVWRIIFMIITINADLKVADWFPSRN